MWFWQFQTCGKDAAADIQKERTWQFGFDRFSLFSLSADHPTIVLCPGSLSWPNSFFVLFVYNRPIILTPLCEGLKAVLNYRLTSATSLWNLR